MSRVEHEETIRMSSKRASAEQQPLLARRQKIKEDIAAADVEIQRYEEEIAGLKALVSLRKDERFNLLKELEATHASQLGKGKAKAKQGIDYTANEFEWLHGVKAKMKEVFGINDFRLCQEG
jgi:ATP-dependent DNA helicase Q1